MEEIEMLLEMEPLCFEWRARKDLISKLPDSLICQILSYLSTKEIVRTSVLSKRWRSLWLLIPKLGLGTNEFPNYNAFVSFVDRFLDFSREEKSCLHKLKLSIQKSKTDLPCVTRWMDFVLRSKLEHLDLECLVTRKFLEEMPLSLYICETLLHLRLHRVSLGKFESISLPRLKTMSLEHNIYVDDAALESFISSCPVLEDLKIVRMVEDNVKVLRVLSQTLTTLDVDFLFGEDDDIVDDFDKKGSIDLPKRNMVRNFFTSISGVGEMKISAYTMEFFHENMDFDPLPQFCNLSCLKVTFDLYNLKSLVLGLEFDPLDESVQIRLSTVPRCLVSSLEFLKIKYFNGGAAKMEVARYFVENTSLLKEVVVRLRCSVLKEGFLVLRDLLALPRRSSTCRIVVC